MSEVKVSHIEVVQSIQNAGNTGYTNNPKCTNNADLEGVPLVTHKTTYARVYFENFNPTDAIRATGKLKVIYPVSDTAEANVEVDSEGYLLRRAAGTPTLLEQRLDWTQSLNFRLPEIALQRAGKIKLNLETLTDTLSGAGITLKLPNLVQEVDLLPKQELACRALIFRYRDVANDEYLEPTRGEVNAIRDYVERSFPVAELDWSVIRVEAKKDFYALDQATHHERDHDETATKMLSKMLEQIMTHRNQEIKDGFSEKTIYIGVFSDPRDRLGSVAVDAPSFPLPHIVAACATDRNGQTSAHEIAHILGRSHPGVPLLKVHGRAIGQHRVDKFSLDQMGKHGLLSPPDLTSDAQVYIGLDVNPSCHLPRVLAPTKTFDLMTYRDPLWPSAYTYRELYKRLACTHNESFIVEPNAHWNVICNFDINRKEGQILSVLPTKYRTPTKPKGYIGLPQFITVRAIEQLNVQVSWLAKNDANKNTRRVWLRCQELLPEYDLVPPPAEKDLLEDGSFTVAWYNDGLNKMITRLRREFEPGTSILELFSSNDIAIELYEPDIRIYPNYFGNDDGEDCPEEKINHMWKEAIKVYYRRVGSIDRFPFGLLQATVPAQSNTDKPPISLTLMIDKIVVDKYAQPFTQESKARDIAKVIFELTKSLYGNGGGMTEPGDGDCEDRPSSNSLVYDIRKDGYYLNFHWPMAVLREQPSNQKSATITTTIQCLRKSQCVDPDTVSDKWETVHVTDELRGQVWTSPDLLEIDYGGACPVNHPSAQRPYRPIAERARDKLTFRFSITVGFYEFFSDSFSNAHNQVYEASPLLVAPKRRHRFKDEKSDQQCPDDFQYDDGAALIPHSH